PTMHCRRRDERSALDATRFILSMRRNGKIPLDQPHIPPPFYLAPRESRHIRGGTQLTFLDLLAGRKFKDGVFRVESNPDIKGLATSDASKSGLIPTDWKALFRATVPYSSLIPESLDNVVIAGKAYCATHDALSAARMQRDLCVMGMVAAEAVRLARNKALLLRNIPVPELQSILIAKGMLKAEDIAEDNLGFVRTPEELAKKIAGSSEMDGALMASAMLCLLPKEQTFKLLEPYMASPNAAVQRLLSFLAHPKGLESYLAQVSEALDASQLTAELFGGTATKHLMPDQGYAPVAALMLGSLARAREQRAVPLLVKLAARIHSDPAGQDLRAGWGYFYSLACGFERLSSPEGRVPLRRVLEAPIFNDRIVSRSGDLRKCNDTVSERFSYLRMALSRALVRCGDAQGALLLCEFLNEARVCIARAARSELVAASGQDFGFDPVRWRAWVQANGEAFRVNPLTVSFA
ncbi:MAG: FAD-dependent oxidoreductase, partial [Verrucomicrobiota bacterium]